MISIYICNYVCKFVYHYRHVHRAVSNGALAREGPPRPPWRGYLMTRIGIHKSSSSSVEKEMLAILLQPYMAIIKSAKRSKIQKKKKSSQKKKEAKI